MKNLSASEKALIFYILNKVNQNLKKSPYDEEWEENYIEDHEALILNITGKQKRLLEKIIGK